MDLFVVNGNFQKTDAVEDFETLVWTERYDSYGDVTLTVPASLDNRALLTENVFLHMPESREIMLIDTVSIENNILTATGQSLVGFLVNRIFRSTWQTTNDAWVVGVPRTGYDIIVAFMQALAASPASYLTAGQVLTSDQGTNEIIPNLTVSTTLPAEPNETFSCAVQFGNLFDAVQQVAQADGLGFTMYPPSVLDGTGNLLFSVYRGLDRTSDQSVNEVVIFDPALDTLTDVKELRSVAGYKNVCWVWPNGATAQTQVGVAYSPGAAALTGFARRSMMLEASDVNAADYSSGTLASVLAAKGRDALANNNYVRMTDGQIVPQNAYVYGIDYNLGDVIELRGPLGTAQAARITEYIRSQDSTGEKAYPTLSVIS